MQQAHDETANIVHRALEQHKVSARLNTQQMFDQTMCAVCINECVCVFTACVSGCTEKPGKSQTGLSEDPQTQEC